MCMLQLLFVVSVAFNVACRARYGGEGALGLGGDPCGVVCGTKVMRQVACEDDNSGGGGGGGGGV